jgi:hypothetical protein
MNRLILAFVVLGIASIFGASYGGQNQKADDVQEIYTAKWKKFLGEISKGTRLADAKEKLGRCSEYLGVLPLGGSGNAELIFQIDDWNELSLLVNKDEIVAGNPELRPRRKWLRFPDGTVTEFDAMKGRK